MKDHADVITTLKGGHGSGRIYPLDDREQLRRAYESIESSSCVYDCYATYSLFEWLSNQGFIKIGGPDPYERISDVLSSPDHRFTGLRLFARKFNPIPFVNNLVLFEKVYINLYGFYADNSDLAKLISCGFLEQYPNPTGSELLNIYRLEKPQIHASMCAIINAIPDLPPYEHLFGNPKSSQYFGNYSGLLSWLYDEEAKARCGLDSQEMGLFDLFAEKYYKFAGILLDFVETVLIFRGTQVAGRAPMISAVANPLKPLNQRQTVIKEGTSSQDTLGLFQIASDSTLGFSFALESFDDVLRLREDRHVRKLRALLTSYINAIEKSDARIVTEIETEINSAKKALKRLELRNHPAYMFLVKPVGFIPFYGQLVSIVDYALDVIEYLQNKKHGWIYFGAK